MSTAAPLRRLPDWTARLYALVAEREVAPFRVGANDCAFFAADAVLAVTGVDPLAALRGRVDDAESARDAIGPRGMFAAMVRHLGRPLPTPALAQRGDVLLVTTPQARRFAAVCLGDRWAAPGRAGLLQGPIAQAERAWRI
jgi:hypothetical protein